MGGIARDQIGVGIRQTWQDKTASRLSSTDYTNDSGRPIVVHVAKQAHLWAYVDGIKVWHETSANSEGSVLTTSFVVPAGSTYRVNFSTEPGTPTAALFWSELR